MGRVPRTPRDAIILQEIGSKNLREFYHWMVQVSEKLEGTDTTLADEEKKSLVPVLGMVQNVAREVDSLIRDGRNMRTVIESLQRVEHENRTLRASIADLQKRVKHLEGEI